MEGQGLNTKFRNYGINEGLSQTSVEQVFQDKKGFMWFATSDGLNKFDGYQFTIYKYDHKNTNSLSDSWVTRIFMEDSDNELWMVTTDQIIHKFNLQTNEFKRFTPNANDSTGLLPFESVLFITEDYQKNIWISTSSGLCRYDKNKKRFFNYCPTGKKSNNIIKEIFEDSKGFLWVLSESGLCRYNHKIDNFIHFNSIPNDNNSISSDIIKRVVEDNSQNLWFLTVNGLNKYNRDQNNFTRYPFDNIELTKKLKFFPYLLMPDKKGQLWIGTNNGLLRFNTNLNQYTWFKGDPSNKSDLSGNIITNLFIDKDNNAWVGTENGINRYNSESCNFEQYVAKYSYLRYSYVVNIFQDRTGEIWVLGFMQPSKTGYLSKINLLTKEIDNINESKYNSESIGKKLLSTPYKDRTGNLWFGSFENGVYKYTPVNKNFEHYSPVQDNPSSLGGFSVWGFTEDNDHNLWVALYNQGFDKFDPRTGIFTHYLPKLITRNGLTASVNSISKASNNDLLIATSGGGLLRFNSKSGVIKQYLNNPRDTTTIASNRVRNAIVDKNGNLWVALFNGLDFLDIKTEKFTHFKHDPTNINSLSSNNVWGSFLDKNEDLWISTAGTGYIDRYNTKTKQFTHFKSKSSDATGLLSNKALCITEDTKGNIWFGTGGGGLSMFDRKTQKFRHWTETDGLPNNTIYGIVEDELGCLWLSTNHGLSKFDVRNGTFTNYNVFSGLQSNEFNMGSSYKGYDNKIYFGGINGFNVVNPHNIVKDTIPNETVFTSFQVLNKEVKVIPPDKRNLIDKNDPDKIISVDNTLFLPKSITYTKRIKLTFREKVLTIEFAALDFRNPEKTRYRYKMNKLDRDWNYSGNRRFVTYTNLRPGEYTLKVTSTNPDGEWNPIPTELIIVITPPFWLTWWFIAIFIIFLASLIICVVRIREKNLKQAKLNLEAKVKKRTHEIVEKNEELKLRNIQILKQKEEIAYQAKQLKVELISQNQASELALLRSQINPHFLFNTLNNIYSLVYQKTDSAPEAVMRLSEIMRYMLYDASVEKVLLENEINYLKSFIELQGLRLKNKEFVQFNIQGQYNGLTLSPMLLIPFVENAFKHGIKKGVNPGIIINLTVKDKRITFDVTNFCHKSDQINKDPIGGIGLANIKRRLELLYRGRYKLDIINTEEIFQVKLELKVQ